MNKVILLGRLTRDPEVRYTQTQNGEQLCIARYTLAIDRRGKDAGTDFPRCVAFGKNGEFAEKYLKQGTKIAATGRIQTDTYTNKDGQKVYTTEVVIEEQEFAESKRSQEATPEAAPAEGFMDVPGNAADDLPFKK